MATMNPFDLLGDDDNEDLTQLIQKVDTKKASAAPPAAAAPPAKLPSKPVPPTQAVREARSEPGSGPRGGGRGGYARGRGGRGPVPNRDYGNGNVNGFSGGYGGGGGGGGGGEDGEQNKPSDGRNRGSYGAPRQPFRGPRRSGYAGNGGDATVGDEEQRPPRRMYERRSGTGRGNEVKREGSGRGNWGTATDDVNAQDIEALNVEEKIVTPEKQTETVPAEDVNKENKENQANEAEEKEPEEKEMTLDEYEKIREEKRKALLALKAEERKVDIKEFASMQQIKKENEDIFIKLGSDKDLLKRRESAERDEKAKKSVSITEFLKPAEGDRHYGGRGRGRGRGERGPYRGGYGGGGGGLNMPAAPKIEDIGQFPSLGGK